MKRRGLVFLAAAASLLVAVPATARVLDHASFPDAAGDGDPDITNVTVGSNAAGGITFVTTIANRTDLAENEFLFVLIDSDDNAATGEQPNGVDYAIQLDREEVDLFRWSGTEMVNAQSQTLYGYIYKGFRIGLNKSELGLTTNNLNFWVETQTATTTDSAPDNEFLVYPLSANPLQLTVQQFRAAAATVRAGRPFSVRMQVHRSDLDEISSAGIVRCTARVGTRAVRVTPTFPAETAICSGVAPRNAKGKTVRVTLTFELDGTRVARTANIRVR